MRNRHFAPQHWMLAPDRMPYTRIYETREIPELLSEFATHLRANGWEGEKLELARSNETPLKPIRALFPDDVLSSMERIYAADFEAFGYDAPLPHGLDPAERYPDAAMHEVARLVERGERISDLALRAREFKRDADAARAKAAAHGERRRPRGRARAGAPDRASGAARAAGQGPLPRLPAAPARRRPARGVHGDRRPPRRQPRARRVPGDRRRPGVHAAEAARRGHGGCSARPATSSSCARSRSRRSAAAPSTSRSSTACTSPSSRCATS